MKKILKKLLLPLLLIGVFAGVMISAGNSKTNAASGWTQIPNSTASLRLVLTNDMFVKEDYSNEITSIGDIKGSSVYLTMYLRTSNTYDSFQGRLSYDSSQVTSVTNVIIAGDFSAIDELTDYDLDSRKFTSCAKNFANGKPANWSNLESASTYGRTSGSQYIDGEASTIAGLIMNDATNTDRSELITVNQSLSSAKRIPACTSIVFKVKLDLASNLTSLDFTSFEDWIISGAANTGSRPTTSLDKANFSLSISQGQLSSSTDTDVEGTNGSSVENVSFTSTDVTKSIIFPASAGQSATLKFTVDGGKGKISNYSSNLTNVTTTSSNDYTGTVSLPSQLGKVETITFDATAQDGSTTTSYTLNVQRMPRLKSVKFEKVDGAIDPGFNSSSSSSTGMQTSGTDVACGNQGTNATYYLWVTNKTTQFKLTASADAPTIKVNGSSYTDGSTTTINVGSTLTIDCISEDGTTTASYTFNICKIQDHTDLGVPTAPGQTGSTNTVSTNSTGGTDYEINIPYYDSSPAKISNINVTGQPKDPSNSDLEYSTDGGQTWTALGSPYAANVSINDGSNEGKVTFRVTDKVSGEYKDYNVTVKRAAGANNNVTLKQFDSSDGSLQNGTFNSGDPAPLTLEYNVPFSLKTFTFNAVPTDSDATIGDLSPGITTVTKDKVYSIDCTKIASGQSQSYTFTVSAKSGNKSQNYTIKINRQAGRNTVSMANLTVNGIIPTDLSGAAFKTNTYTSGKNNKEVYIVNLGKGANIQNVIAQETQNLGITNTQVVGSTSITNDKYVLYTYTLTSEDGNTVCTYEVHIFAAEDEHGLNDLHLNKYKGSDLIDTSNNQVYTYSSTNKSATATIAWANRDISANFSTKSSTATVMYNGSAYTNGNQIGLTPGQLNTVTFDVYSEYDTLLQKFLGSQATVNPEQYTFNLTVNAEGTENRLKSFSFQSDTGTGNWKNNTITEPYAQKTTFVIENLGSATTITINFAKVESYERVYFNGINTEPNPLSYTHNINFSSGKESFTISVWGEDTSASATPNIYTIELHSASATLSNNTTLGPTTIDEVSQTNQIYNAVPTKTTEGTADKANASLGETAVDINVGLPSGSQATAHLAIKGPNDSTYNEVNLNSKYRLTLTPSTTGPVSYFLEIWAVAQDSTVGTKYYVEVVVPQVSSDATLKNEQIGSDLCTPDSSDKIFNEVTESATTNGLTFKPNLNDASATFTVNPTNGITYNANNGTLNGLKKGDNVIFVTVTAGDKKTTKQYETHIWVDEDSQPDNLEILNYQINYNKNTKSYTITVPYADTQETFRYTLPTGVNTQLLKFTYSVDGGAYRSFDPTQDQPFNLNLTADTVLKVKIEQNYSPMAPQTPLASSWNEYEITIKRQAPQGTSALTEVTIDVDDNPSTETIQNPNVQPDAVVRYYNRTFGQVNFTNITHNGVSYTLKSTTSQAIKTANDAWRVTLPMGGMAKVTITVKAQDGSESSYDFILIAAEKDYEPTNMIINDISNKQLDDINGANIQFNPATISYGTFKYYSTVNSLVIEITKPQYSTLIINGKSIKTTGTKYTYTVNLTATDPQTQQVTIQIESEAWGLYNGTNAAAGQSKVYTIDLTKAPKNSDATLKELEATVVGLTGNQITGFTAGDHSSSFIITNVGTAASISIKARPTIASTTINSSTQDPFYQTFNLSANGSTVITLTTLAEDGVTQEVYTITVYRGQFTPQDDNNLIDIEVIDSTNTYYLSKTGIGGSTTFNPATNTYTIKIPYGAMSYTITPSVDVANGSLATAYVTNTLNAAIANKLQTAITTAMWGTTVTHSVYAISQSGKKGTVYTINIEFEKPSTDNTLSSLTADGVELLDPTDPTKTTFNLNRANNITTIDIAAIVNDPNATISGDIGTLPLQVGLNTFNVIVTAQDGTQKIYTINVNRAEPSPELKDLGVTGEQLLDTNKKATTFDPKVKEYRVVLPYDHETADIYATSSTASDVITGTGKFPISVGTQTRYVNITNASGLTTQYKIIITRLPKAASNANLDSVVIDELNRKKESITGLEDKLTQDADGSNHKFADDFTSDKIYYGKYTVPNKASSLDVNATPQIATATADYDAAKVEVLGADKLHVGNNQIVILVTAPDGVTQKAYVIEVVREAASFEVDEDKVKADGFKLEKVEGQSDYEYNLDGSKSSSKVDFASYIKDLSPDDQDLEITVLTDTSKDPSTVVVMVSTADGEFEYVIFNCGEGFSWAKLLPFLILLIIIIILLTWILISVNKDKYGKITRKADKKSDKNQKKQDSNSSNK